MKVFIAFLLDCPRSQALVSEQTKRTLVNRVYTVGISVKFGKICSVTVTSVGHADLLCVKDTSYCP